ncbi:hypothetical protein Q5P01_015632 [Channa striata]|uniref:Sushi domain-containing protein n=1 Tax=Channa striata TaxID=64152 RepID=A0AA88MCP5_CHASR|nr:hypothetical protein Q5P01_015632 [Channa striata]
MHLSVVLLLLHLWGNVGLSSSQNACSQLPLLLHANISEGTKKAEYNEGDVIAFTCEPGFLSDQPSKFVCTRGGWLTVRQGHCYSCSQLPVVPHAHVSEETRKAEYQLGNVIHFTCEAGYTSDLTIRYVCLKDGWLAVHNETCYFQASGCERPPADGDLTIKGLPEDQAPILPDRFIEISCPPGKKVNGSSVLICGKDGQWNNPIPTCEVVTCEPPPEDLIVKGLPEDQGPILPDHVVEISCPPEKSLNGSSVLICGKDGQWNNPIPTCEDKCRVPSPPQGLWISPQRRPGSMLNRGETLRFSCRTSSQFLHGNAVVECLGNGQWSHRFPTCGAVKCEVPVLEHGSVRGDIRDYNEHEVLHYECLERYRKTEERPSKCTKIGQRADWSPTPACESSKCKLDVLSPEGTRYEPANRNVFLPGQTLRVTCGEKYWISSPRDTSALITCNDDGKWELDPVCREVTCNRPPDRAIYLWNNYWDRKITLHDTVRYSCRSGYKKPDGVRQATCTRGGWSPDPLCQEITCDTRDIPNASTGSTKQIYKYNEQARFVCNEGFRGDFWLSCRENGWDQNQRCEEITCRARPYRGADIVNYKSTYKYKEQAVYKCRGGYEGGFSLTCTEQGWTGQTQCTEITCDRRDIPNASTQNVKDKYQYAEQVNYVCNEGYRGRFTLTCGENWDQNPQCEEITCRARPYRGADIINYKSTTGLDWTNTVYRKTVPKTEHRRRIRSHQRQGSVRQQRPSSVCVQNDTDKQFTVTCEQGVWAGIQNCTELAHCGLPPFVADGDVKYSLKSQYRHEERVEYMCQIYYTMEGGPNKTCVNGEWAGHVRCLKPCIVNEDDFRQHNVTLKSSSGKFLVHEEVVEFSCARGEPVGAVALRQRCNSGVLILPSCN